MYHATRISYKRERKRTCIQAFGMIAITAIFIAILLILGMEDIVLPIVEWLFNLIIVTKIEIVLVLVLMGIGVLIAMVTSD